MVGFGTEMYFHKSYISDYRTPALDEDYQLQLIFDSYDNWIVDAPCAQLSHSFEGIREGHHQTGRDNSDAKNTFYWDDPNDEQGSGILGVTYTLPSGQAAFARDGLFMYTPLTQILSSPKTFSGFHLRMWEVAVQAPLSTVATAEWTSVGTRPQL